MEGGREATLGTRRTVTGDKERVGRLADLLAERGHLDELRARADAGDGDAAARLADLLAERGDLDGAATVPGCDRALPITPKLSAASSPPELAVRTGALIGYARVSTSGQLLDRQQHALAEADCLRVFADKLSGKNSDGPGLAACLD